MIERKAVATELLPKGLPDNALIAVAPLELTWYCVTELPVKNKVCPAAEIELNKEFEFADISKLSICPPQPSTSKFVND